MQGLFDSLFDNIFVVSLPRSSERRASIRKHFAEIGLNKFEFFDAIDADATDVIEAYDAGLVATYPPCFRCGKNACGNDACNNVLLAPQVANFLTYLKLWKKISATPQCTLVVEDDVRFEANAAESLSHLGEAHALGEFAFSAEVPTMLRLGWARCKDHASPAPFHLSTEIRMSNPCHGMTSAFAEAVLRRFSLIDMTSDMYLHGVAPRAGEASTVFPPLASELSWSTGAVPSLIHPKSVRTEYLRQNGEELAAQENERAVANHLSHKWHRPYLIVGHPRCGTGFAATLMGQLGLEIGHEADGADGVSSWMFAVEADAPYATAPIAVARKALDWDFLIQPVRDISTAVSSVMRDNLHAPPSYAFRRSQIQLVKGVNLDDFPTNFERAVLSVVLWSEIVNDMKPDVVFRIEDGADTLLGFLAQHGIDVPSNTDSLDLRPVNVDKPYQGTRHPKPAVTADDWASLSPTTWVRVIAYCNRYGYPAPSRQTLEQVQDAGELTALRPLYKLFLRPSGWERSRVERRPVRVNGRPLPWFTYGAIEFLGRVIRSKDRVFEYGAGFGTLWWQHRVAKVVSVDHDADWCAELRPQLTQNVTLTQSSAGDSWPDVAEPFLAKFFSRAHESHWPNYDAEKVVRRGLDDRAYRGYAAKILTNAPPFDVVVIDGMARRLCAEFAVSNTSSNGIIILDNSNRGDYDAAFDILEEAEFRQVPFWGLVPGASFLTCTSIFLRTLDRLAPSGHVSNSFDLAEY